MPASKFPVLENCFDDITRHMTKTYSRGKFHAAVLCREVFARQNADIGKIPEFNHSGSLAVRLAADIAINPGQVIATVSDGKATKFLTSLGDGNEIESVLVPMKTYTTLCISSQVGCRWGCVFCETGKKGFIRNLTVEEIVGQLYNARLILKKGQIKNIVFMGMGEPLDNTENVVQAIKVFSDQHCFNIARKNITVSTVGIPHQLARMPGMLSPLPNLAVSLNAAFDSTRSRIMPVNRKYGLCALRDALLSLPLPKKRVIFFEYVLMQNLNDAYADAQQLVQFLTPFRARLNLIPYNENSCAGIQCPDDQTLIQFRDWLVAGGVFVRKRTARGDTLAAGCGQLGNWKPI